MVLDLLEVKERHTGINLAQVFMQVLRDFGIQDKVRKQINFMLENTY